MSGRPCQVCHNPLRNEIDLRLANLETSDDSFRQISLDYGIHERALRRHHKSHLLPQMAQDLEEDSELKDIDLLAEVRALYRRMKARLDKADALTNWKVEQAFHRECREDLALLARLLGQLREQSINVNLSQTTNIYQSPEWDRVGEVLYEILEPYPEVRAKVAERLLELSREAKA